MVLGFPSAPNHSCWRVQWWSLRPFSEGTRPYSVEMAHAWYFWRAFCLGSPLFHIFGKIVRSIWNGISRCFFALTRLQKWCFLAFLGYCPQGLGCPFRTVSPWPWPIFEHLPSEFWDRSAWAGHSICTTLILGFTSCWGWIGRLLSDSEASFRPCRHCGKRWSSWVLLKAFWALAWLFKPRLIMGLNPYLCPQRRIHRLSCSNQEAAVRLSHPFS